MFSLEETTYQNLIEQIYKINIIKLKVIVITEINQKNLMRLRI